MQLGLSGAALGAVMSAHWAPKGAHRRGYGLPVWLVVCGLLVAITAPGGLLVGPDAGAIPLAQAVSGDTHDALYGPAWPALAHAISGGDPRLVFVLNRVLAALFPAGAVLLLRALMPTLRAGTLAWAALCAALAPGVIRLAGTEIPHWTLLWTELLALSALGRAVHASLSLRAALASGLTGACLAGLAAAVRPEALPFAALPLVAAALAHGRRRLGLGALAAVALGLAAPRLVDVYGHGPASGVAAPAALGAVLRAPALLIATDGPVLPTCVALGLAAALRGAAAGPRLAAAALALVAAPTLHKTWPLADLWRLQLATLGPALVLAVVGACALPHLGRAFGLPPRLDALLSAGAPGRFGLLVVVLAGLLGLPTQREAWAPRADWDAMSAAATSLPPGATLLIAGDTPHAHLQATALAAIAATQHAQTKPARPALWVSAAEGVQPASPGAETPQLYAYEGLRCAVGYPLATANTDATDPTGSPCQTLRSRCRVETIREQLVPPRGDLDLRWPQTPIPLRLLRVHGCTPGVGWAPASP